MKLIEFQRFNSKEFITLNVETVTAMYEHVDRFVAGGLTSPIKTGTKKGTTLVIGNVHYPVEGKFKDIKKLVVET